ncbi:MAG: hypothetical protein WAZ18_06830 [Alphaproteobacteria bacterium]
MNRHLGTATALVAALASSACSKGEQSMVSKLMDMSILKPAPQAPAPVIKPLPAPTFTTQQPTPKAVPTPVPAPRPTLNTGSTTPVSTPTIAPRPTPTPPTAKSNIPTPSMQAQKALHAEVETLLQSHNNSVLWFTSDLTYLLQHEKPFLTFLDTTPPNPTTFAMVDEKYRSISTARLKVREADTSGRGS